MKTLLSSGVVIVFHLVGGSSVWSSEDMLIVRRRCHVQACVCVCVCKPLLRWVVHDRLCEWRQIQRLSVSEHLTRSPSKAARVSPTRSMTSSSGISGVRSALESDNSGASLGRLDGRCLSRTRM